MRIAAVFLLVATAVGWAAWAESEKPAAADKSAAVIDPLGPNSACYVCHMTFVREELVKRHLPEKVGCVDCHGPSIKHANDEDIGATPPDIRFRRDQVDAACVKCHDEHDAPAAKVVARFIERQLPAKSAPICTDCHGKHRIDRAATNRTVEKE